MRYMNMALLIAVMVFSVGSVKANEPSRSTDWEWVDYDGEDELPDNVVTSRNDGEGDPICSAPVPGTSEYRVGWLNVRELKCFIPGAAQEEKRYAAREGIRVLVHRQPDQQVFHFVPYAEWLAGPQTWPWNREICASHPDGEKKVRVGSLHRGHRCVTVGGGRNTQVLEKPDFMVLISTPEDQAAAEAEAEAEAEAQAEAQAEAEAEAEEQSQMELVGDTLLERLNDVGAAVETKTQDRELLKKKDHLIKRLMWRIDPLLEENASLQAEREEQRERKIVRWAEKALKRACRRSDRDYQWNEVANGVAAPWGGHFKFKGDSFSKTNACAPVTPEAGPGDPLLWKRLNNLEKFTEKDELRGIDWTARMELVRESVVQLIAENDTLQAERDSRFALQMVRVAEDAISEFCGTDVKERKCRSFDGHVNTCKRFKCDIHSEIKLSNEVFISSVVSAPNSTQSFLRTNCSIDGIEFEER